MSTTTQTSATAHPSIWVELLGAEVRWYDAAGVRTRVIEAAPADAGPDTKTVILLHGVGGHAEAFARNVIPLAGRFRVLAVDFLGFGLTDRPAGPVGARDYVAHLVALMDAAGVDRAHLVGESLGGWVSLWTALEAPDRVDRIVSVCGARFAVEEDPESERHVAEGLAELKRLSAQLADDPSPAHVRARLTWLFHHPDVDITDELVDIRWRLYQHEESAKALGATSASVIRYGASDDEGLNPERLERVTHPTLVLWTEHNPSTTAATARRAATHFPDARFHLMGDCAHWPQWEKPAEFNTIVGDFLAG